MPSAGMPVDTTIPPSSSVIAGYALPQTRFDWSVPPHLRTCEAVLENAVVWTRSAPTQSGMAAGDKGSTADSASGSRASLGDTSVWLPLAPDAVALGRECLGHVRMADLPSYDWPIALRLAVGVNDDTLMRVIVQKQLAWVSSMVGLTDTARTRQQAEVLDTAVFLLWQNRWNNDTTSHRTPAHDTLARVLAARLDTMQPSGLVFATRLKLFELFNASDVVQDGDTAGDIAAQRTFVQQRARLARSVDVSTASSADQVKIHDYIDGEPMWLAFLDYLQTPTHDKFVAYLTARGPMVNPVVQLEGQRASALHGDYWFASSAGHTPTVPEAGKATLLIFFDAEEGRIPSASTTRTLFTRAQRLHTQYPQLQILWVVMTQGRFRDQDYRAHPEQEADQIHRYLTDELHLPGLLCVIRTQYHTEVGATAVPFTSPVLDAYHLDPQGLLNGNSWQFLVDQNGWIVATGTDAGGFTQRLIPRLLAR